MTTRALTDVTTNGGVVFQDDLVGKTVPPGGADGQLLAKASAAEGDTEWVDPPVAGTGDVVAPATNNADYVPQWNGPNSKTLKNGRAIGAAASTDILDRAAGDARYRAAGAIPQSDVTNLTTDLAAKIPTSYLDTDTALTANSDVRVATQKAVKAYVDQIVASQDAMVFKGVIDCSANPNYPAADRGWTYRVSVAGKIGGASGVNVTVGDIVLCLTDGTASGNQATVGSNWSVIQANLDGALTTADIGVTLQAYDADLAAIAALSTTSYGRAFLTLADAAAGRTALGLGALATLATVGTSQIDNDAVTYAKIQNVSATARILGRISAGAGDVEELTAANLKTILALAIADITGLQAALDAKADLTDTFVTVSTTTYTLLQADLGKLHRFTNASGCAVTLPNSFPAGWNILWAQIGAGQITFTPASGATRRNSSSHTKSRVQYSEGSLRVDTNSGGTAAEYYLSGDTAA
mgnify:CR=1 FL=1